MIKPFLAGMHDDHENEKAGKRPIWFPTTPGPAIFLFQPLSIDEVDHETERSVTLYLFGLGVRHGPYTTFAQSIGAESRVIPTIYCGPGVS